MIDRQEVNRGDAEISQRFIDAGQAESDSR